MNIELNVYMRMMGKMPVNQDKFGENSIHFIVSKVSLIEIVKWVSVGGSKPA